MRGYLNKHEFKSYCSVANCLEQKYYKLTIFSDTIPQKLVDTRYV